MVCRQLADKTPPVAPVKFFESLPELEKQAWIEAAAIKRKDIEATVKANTSQPGSLKHADGVEKAKPQKATASLAGRGPTAYQLWRTAVAGKITVPAGQTILEVYNKLSLEEKQPYVQEADRQKALVKETVIVLDSEPQEPHKPVSSPSAYELWKKANPAVLAELKALATPVRPQVHYAQLPETERQPFEEQVSERSFLKLAFPPLLFSILLFFLSLFGFSLSHPFLARILR